MFTRISHVGSQVVCEGILLLVGLGYYEYDDMFLSRVVGLYIFSYVELEEFRLLKKIKVCSLSLL